MLLKPDADDTGDGAFSCVHIPASFTARGSPQPGLEADSGMEDKRNPALTR